MRYTVELAGSPSAHIVVAGVEYYPCPERDRWVALEEWAPDISFSILEPWDFCEAPFPQAALEIRGNTELLEAEVKRRMPKIRDLMPPWVEEIGQGRWRCRMCGHTYEAQPGVVWRLVGGVLSWIEAHRHGRESASLKVP